MRCNNCKRENGPGRSFCVYCGTPLQAEKVEGSSPYRDANVSNYKDGGNAQLHATVMDTRQSQPMPRPTVRDNSSIQAGGQMKATVSESPQSCPHCGYPMIGNSANCPNCGREIEKAPKPTTVQNPKQMEMPQQVAPRVTTSGGANSLAELGYSDKVICSNCKEEVSIDFAFCPKCGERIHLPTVRVNRRKQTPPPEPPKPKCHLTLIPEEEEQMEPTCNDYEGDTIILTRENTEASNRTITSKEQAELTCEDGKWFLQNKSEFGSTYLEANRKLELQAGDVIILGDRRFRFEAEKLE